MSSFTVDIVCPACGSRTAAQEDHSTIIRGTGVEEVWLECLHCGFTITTAVIEVRIIGLKELNGIRLYMGLRPLKEPKKIKKHFNIKDIRVWQSKK